MAVSMGELHSATHHLSELVGPSGGSSVRACLLRGPSGNSKPFARALSDLEKQIQNVASRVHTLAEKGIGKEEEKDQIVEASNVLKSATALLQETRSKFHIQEYPSGLSFWNKAIINVKRFFSLFTKTRYVEIDAVPLNVQKLSLDIHEAVRREFEKVLPPDFAQKHGVAVTLGERKVEGPQKPTVIEVTEQGELRGTVSGYVVQARSWKELGDRIDDIRSGLEQTRVNRAALMKELEEKSVSSIPPELPEGSWYVRKKDKSYVFCQQGQPEKQVAITDATTAKSINELFGVHVSDETFVLNMLWKAEKRKLDQMFLDDESSYSAQRESLTMWVSPQEAAATFFFAIPGEVEGEEARVSVQIGVGKATQRFPLTIDDSTRTFSVRIEDKECMASSVEGLQKQILGATFHGEPVRHISSVIPIADKNAASATLALKTFQEALRGQILESTEEAIEEELLSSSTVKGLSEEGKLACHPWKNSEGDYFLTVVKEGQAQSFPIDHTSQPGKIILKRKVDEGGDIALWPQESTAKMKQVLQEGFGVQEALLPEEYSEIRKMVGPRREELLAFAEMQLEAHDFSKIVRLLGKNVQNAVVLQDIKDRSVTIHWWDGNEEKDVVVDLMQNPGQFTVDGKKPYLTLQSLFQEELGISPEEVVSPKELLSRIELLDRFIRKEFRENPLYAEKDPSKEILEMIHRVEVPQGWWIAQRKEEKGRGFLGQVVGAGKWVKDLVTGERGPQVEEIKEKYCIKVCTPDGAVEQIPLQLVFIDGMWKVAEEGRNEVFDTVEKLVQARSGEIDIDPQYNQAQLQGRNQRHLAVEKEIETSGVGTGKVMLKQLAGLFTEVFSYKFYEGEIADVEPLARRLAQDAKTLKQSVGCVFRLERQNTYQVAICRKEGGYSVFDLEIDSKTDPGTFGIKGGKKFESFSAFRDEMLKDVLALADAEKEIKKKTAVAEVPQKEPSREEGRGEPKVAPQPQRPERGAEKAEPEARREGALPIPARPDWLDLTESWVTVGKGKRLDKDIRKLIENVNAAQSIVTCDAAGGLNTDERAFHAWVKALGGASEKLGAQDLDTLEACTRKLPLLERFWLYEVAVNSRIISGQRQVRAMHVLEHCLKADVKPEEQQQLIDYLKANAARYGNARTKEEAIDVLKAKVRT